MSRLNAPCLHDKPSQGIEEIELPEKRFKMLSQIVSLRLISR